MGRCSWLRHCATNSKVAGSIPNGVTRIFHLQYFHPKYGLGVVSSANRKEYQYHFVGG